MNRLSLLVGILLVTIVCLTSFTPVVDAQVNGVANQAAGQQAAGSSRTLAKGPAHGNPKYRFPVAFSAPITYGFVSPYTPPTKEMAEIPPPGGFATVDEVKGWWKKAEVENPQGASENNMQWNFNTLQSNNPSPGVFVEVGSGPTTRFRFSPERDTCVNCNYL